ncbi:hypothetical protein JG687_00017945 [Phytophthora cactorum]|uniref:Uncharacterized protein n=1 Tax=Phytophthora cactorum TaxID=29920 RepID=A0A8T1TLQ5_9STRA|nr:hypothetical protein JG687_00017945 [Phytophthora cactorum]
MDTSDLEENTVSLIKGRAEARQRNCRWRMNTICPDISSATAILSTTVSPDRGPLKDLAHHHYHGDIWYS